MIIDKSNDHTLNLKILTEASLAHTDKMMSSVCYFLR